MDNTRIPPGAPGIGPTWTPAAKSGIGKAINSLSNIVFTLNKGIVTEVYYPQEDIACIKDCGFIVTSDSGFFADEKNNTRHREYMIKEGIPAYRVTNTSMHGEFTIEKEIIADPFRDTLLQRITFTNPHPEDIYRLYVSLTPHINNQGTNNTGWVGKYKGTPMLFASDGELVLAMACSSGWQKRSVGYVGLSDCWHDLSQNKDLQYEYQRAENGNIVLAGEIKMKDNVDFVLAISFGRTASEAGNRACASLMDGFSNALDYYVKEWENWQSSLKIDFGDVGKIIRTSVAVLRMNEAKRFPGGVIASLAVPWGTIKGSNDLSGYHVVWPRDLVESSGGFLAIRSMVDALRIANYLMSTQEEDGKWWQNMWLQGEPHWKGIQLDQVALPILLIANCQNQGMIDEQRMKRYWPGIRKALSFLIINGPLTEQDRWEEEKGLTAFTLAVEVAGLLAGAMLAEVNGEREIAEFCRQTADYWNENIETWTYVTDTDLTRELEINGYYMRINPHKQPAEEIKDEIIQLKNHNGENGKLKLNEIICVDALALVRFGLRAADDPRILDTLKAIDAKLKIETSYGPCWHRYTMDGYGEDAEGNPYNGVGIGRGWPLLTGERAHYEIAAGHINEARKLLTTMESFSNNGLLPEQIWDTDDIPEKDLFLGRPSGSAMPLTWAHAEYLKLCCSIKEGRVFDLAEFTHHRYIQQKTESKNIVWRFDWPCTKMGTKNNLRIETLAQAVVHWSTDHWKTLQQTQTTDTGLGLHIADISLKKTDGAQIYFTFYWTDACKWEGKNFEVDI